MNWLRALCNPTHLISTKTSKHCVYSSTSFYISSYRLSPFFCALRSPSLYFLSDRLFASPPSDLFVLFLHHISRNLTNPRSPANRYSTTAATVSLLLYHSLPAFFTYSHTIILSTPFLSCFFSFAQSLFPPFTPICCSTDILDVPPLEANPWLSVFRHGNFPSPNILHLHCNPSSSLLLLAYRLFSPLTNISVACWPPALNHPQIHLSLTSHLTLLLWLPPLVSYLFLSASAT